jgi:hypothetical protein
MVVYYIWDSNEIIMNGIPGILSNHIWSTCINPRVIQLFGKCCKNFILETSLKSRNFEFDFSLCVLKEEIQPLLQYWKQNDLTRIFQRNQSWQNLYQFCQLWGGSFLPDTFLFLIRGDASEAKILEAIADKAAEKGVAGEWDSAAEITFSLEDYLTLHGFPQRSMELLMELDIKKLNETNR